MEHEPALLWSYFEDLCQIPRGSGNEAGARAYVREFAKKHGFGYVEDSNANPNCLVTVPGRGVGRYAPPVTLQSHLDMVCVKDDAVVHDFTRDPIRMREFLWTEKSDTKRFLMGTGTTLGADNGIGVVAAMAVATDPELTDCPPLELLFTVEEETGLTGARRLGRELLRTDLLINLDTEELGEICISCAGGRDITADWTVTRNAPAPYELPVKLSLTGLPGGHSGVQIHERRGNAILLLLQELLQEESTGGRLKLASFTGGTARNVIPGNAEIVIWVSEEQAQLLEKTFHDPKRKARIQAEILEDEEDKIALGFDRLTPETALWPLSPAESQTILNVLAQIPSGPLRWSELVPDLVETSNNVAVVSTSAETLHLQCSTRSSKEGAITAFQDTLTSALETSGAKVAVSEGYPGWPADAENPLLRQALQTFENVLGYTPKVTAVHAGLECGVLKGKRASLQMISFGPDIFGAHTINERIGLESVPPFYACLKGLLHDLATIS